MVWCSLTGFGSERGMRTCQRAANWRSSLLSYNLSAVLFAKLGFVYSEWPEKQKIRRGQARGNKAHEKIKMVSVTSASWNEWILYFEFGCSRSASKLICINPETFHSQQRFPQSHYLWTRYIRLLDTYHKLLSSESGLALKQDDWSIIVPIILVILKYCQKQHHLSVPTDFV